MSHNDGTSRAPGAATEVNVSTGARPDFSSGGSVRTTRLVLGLVVACGLTGVALLSRPSSSVAGLEPTGPGTAARLSSSTTPHRPQFELETPPTTFIEAGGLAGHSGIPLPPATDEAGRSSLGVLVGPALFVWVFGDEGGVRYSVVDVRGQVLAKGLTAAEVYGAFPEINIPEMQFGPDGMMCEPIMWAGDDIE